MVLSQDPFPECHQKGTNQAHRNSHGKNNISPTHLETWSKDKKKAIHLFCEGEAARKWRRIMLREMQKQANFGLKLMGKATLPPGQKTVAVVIMKG